MSALESPSTYAGDRTLITVGTLDAFIEAAYAHPRSLLILRRDAAPSSAELRRYCIALGGVLQFENDGDVRMVRNDPTISNSTAMSIRALAPHTDGAFLARPPERFILSFVAKDPAGGVSTFMPISQIMAAAPDWALDAFTRADLLFVRRYDGDLADSFVGPALWRDSGSLRIRWRSDDIRRPLVVNSHGTQAERAVDWLHEFLIGTPPLEYAADSGETLLVPNTVFLHGRTALSPNSSREVLRAWVA